MAQDLPRFEAPPVVETVLSAQFAPLSAFTVAHAGWFWKNYLDASYSSVSEVQRLADASEEFGEHRTWQRPSLSVLPVGKEAQRLQIVRDDQERMIQVQNSRFIQNWRKHTGNYPSFGKLLPEFEEHFGRFQSFATDGGLGDVELNQWEVIYVNLIPKGELWSSPEEWKKILPWLGMPIVAQGNRFDIFASGEWQFVIGDNVGRLFVSLTHVMLGSSKDGHQNLRLQLMARGPLRPNQGINLRQGLEIGHEAIVRSFTAMTSDLAHKHWKRIA